MYDLIIIGTGAAGLSTGIYTGRYKMKVLAVGKEFGGETALAGKVENYPGFKEIDGYDLMKKMKDQAENLGVEIKNGEITKIERNESCFKVQVGDEEYKANALVFANGTERRRLGLPNEKELTGKGVHYCITCDGPLYSDKTIAIVGGGDASVKGVNLASEYAEKIYLIVRDKEIKAEPINYERMKKLGDKVEVLLETEVKKIVGDEKFEKVVLAKPYKGSEELEADALFIEIGAEPEVELAKSLGVELDERGYVKVDNMMRTNVDGVFAAGDITNHFESFKQDITAAAMGSVAATSAYDYKKIHGELCKHHHVPVKTKLNKETPSSITEKRTPVTP